MNITIKNCEGLLHTTLSEWFAVDDGVSAEEQEEIRRTLERGETYRGGGGATPTFTVKKEQT